MMAGKVPRLSLAFFLLCLATSWIAGGAQSCAESCINGECQPSGTCECTQRWYGTNCSEYNPCLNGGTHIPDNTSNDVNCDCPDDFGGPLCAYYQGQGAVILCGPGGLDCGPYGTCIIQDGNQTCLCNHGYSGALCVEEDPCLTRGCYHGGNCTYDNFLTCECPFGYSNSFQCLHPLDQYRLCDVDPCENGGSCSYPVPIPQEGLPYICECAPGFTGLNCTVLACDQIQCFNEGECEVDHCVCPLGWTGDNCSIFDDPCKEVVCKNGGQCEYDLNSTWCACPSNFTGDDCCDDVDECASGAGVCENGGVCFNTLGGHLCLCADGYFGPTCSEFDDHCSSTPCQNGGTCENKVGKGYKCKCGSDHVGLNCEILKEDTCFSDDNPCHFGGQCVEDPFLDRHICNCSSGYTGEFCLYEYQPCKDAQCNSTGTLECTFEGGIPACSCRPGFTGAHCETATVCTSFPCENGGTCEVGENDDNYSCSCAPGYTGGNCQDLIYSECVSDQHLDCVHGNCFQLEGEEYCKCDAGWGGKYCSIDVDECSQFPCHNGGTCDNSPGGYTCTCPSGYSGVDCVELEARSCNPNPCQNGGTCMPGPTPVCSCQPGYAGPLCETDDCSNDQCPALAGNGICNAECFTAGCGFDGGRDCFTPSGSDPWVICPNRDYCQDRYNNDYCDQDCNNGRCLYDGNDCVPEVKTCSEEMISTCTALSGDGTCNKQCDTAECHTYDSDCGQNPVYLPEYLVMVLASLEIDAFEGSAKDQFLADLGKVIHAIVEVVEVVQLSEDDIDRLPDIEYKSQYYYWRVTMAVNIQYCEASCPTSIYQVLGSIEAAYSSGRTSIGDFEVVDANQEEPSTPPNTTQFILYSMIAVCVAVVIVVAVLMIGKRVRDNGGLKAAVKKIRVRSTWQVPGGATPEPVSSPLTRGQSLTSDGRSSSVEPILDPSGKRDGFPHCTLSRIEVPIHPGASSEASCVLGESGKDSRKWTPLHQEAAHQSSETLKRIVAGGMARNGSTVDINSQGPGGFTPLMVAIVAEKGPWRIRSHSGHTVRSDSSSGSEHSEHDFLLNSSHSSPYLPTRRIPSKREMQESRIAALITQETDINLVNDQGQTALHLAVQQSRGDFVQVLLAAKADPNVQDMWGQSPLHVAIGAAAEGCFKVMLDHPKTNIELKSQGGITPLMMAVMMVKQNMVKILVQRNADIAATDSEGRTAVHWAAMLNNVEALKLLVRQGPDNVKDASNSKGETALFLACKEGCTESVRHLLDCFANTTLLDNLERSPMQIAYEKQNRDIVEMLQQSSQGHMVPPPPYMKHMTPAHSATGSPMFGRMPPSGGIKMEPQATSMHHPTVTYPSSQQHQTIYHPHPENSAPTLTFGDFPMGRQSSVERALDYLVESTLLRSQPPTDHSPSLRLTHPSDSPPYMATGSYADPSNQPQSSASMMHGSGVPVQEGNHASPSHPVISPGMQPGASMGVAYSQGPSVTGGSYDPVSTATGVYASPSEMESLTTFSPATVSASNQPIMTHHTQQNPPLNSIGSKPLQHLPYHGSYSMAPTVPATSMNPMATSDGQYLPSMANGHTVASSVEQSSQGYDNANMHPSLSPLSAQTVSPNSQALHMPQAQHSGFSPNTAPPLSAGENKSPYSYGFPSPPKGPDDYSYSGASYQAVVGDVNSLTPSPEDYSNCAATEHSPMRPQATIIHGHYAAQEQMYPGVQLYHDYALQTHAQLQGPVNSSLKESTV